MNKFLFTVVGAGNGIEHLVEDNDLIYERI